MACQPAPRRVRGCDCERCSEHVLLSLSLVVWPYVYALLGVLGCVIRGLSFCRRRKRLSAAPSSSFFFPAHFCCFPASRFRGTTFALLPFPFHLTRARLPVSLCACPHSVVPTLSFFNFPRDSPLLTRNRARRHQEGEKGADSVNERRSEQTCTRSQRVVQNRPLIPPLSSPCRLCLIDTTDSTRKTCASPSSFGVERGYDVQ